MLKMKKYLLGALLTFSVAGTQAADLKSQDIVDVAVGAGSFKTLVAAVKAADLVGTLKGDGPFTVFAPTDEAFNKLPKGTLESLLKPGNKKKLQDILKYHVVEGRVKAKDVVNLNVLYWEVKLLKCRVFIPAEDMT